MPIFAILWRPVLHHASVQKVLDYVCSGLAGLKPERVVLFGSRARGDGTDRSDFDIAVWGSHISREQWVRVKLDLLENVPTLCGVDLLLIDETMSPELLASIQRDGKVMCGKE